MQNNLKMSIKILITIYLSIVVLFPSVPLYWVHKIRNFPIMREKSVDFQSPFLNDNETFNNDI